MSVLEFRTFVVNIFQQKWSRRKGFRLELKVYIHLHKWNQFSYDQHRFWYLFLNATNDFNKYFFKIHIPIGLNASNEELNLKAQNIWAFTTNESGDTFDKYLDMDVEEAMDAKVPLMFISFPRYDLKYWSWVTSWFIGPQFK